MGWRCVHADIGAKISTRSTSFASTADFGAAYGTGR
jgi:hypothetical protein